MKKLMTIGFAVLVLASVCSAQTLVQEQKIVQALSAQDVNNVQTNGLWVSMKNYGHIQLVVQCGVINASSTGFPVTVEQATSVAGTDEKAVTFSNYWQNGISGDIYTNTACSSQFSIINSSDLKTFIIELDVAALDVDNGFDCVQLQFGLPSAHSAIVNAFYILSKPRYTGDAASQPSALSD
ncbi:MAG: hypothetical protein WC554_17090 [Clostridia bacterium]|jgi:hypothetical protein